MSEDMRDYITLEASEYQLLDLTDVELQYIEAEIQYYECCMSSSMDMGSVHEHAEAVRLFESTNPLPERKQAIDMFLNEVLSD